MQVWVYGASLEQVQEIIKAGAGLADTVVGTSIHAEAGSAFPYSGLTPAMSAAMRGEIELLLIPGWGLLGDKAQAAQLIRQFQSYGVLIKSVSSRGSSSS